MPMPNTTAPMTSDGPSGAMEPPNFLHSAAVRRTAQPGDFRLRGTDRGPEFTDRLLLRCGSGRRVVALLAQRGELAREIGAFLLEAGEAGIDRRVPSPGLD